MRFRPDRLASARHAAGYHSAEALGEAIGVSGQAVRTWEAGQHSPSEANLAKLVEVTGKPVGYFYGEDQPDLIQQIRELQEQLRDSIPVLDGTNTSTSISRVPLMPTAGNHDGGVIEMPAILLPEDVPHAALLAAYADAHAPSVLNEGDLVIAVRVDNEGFPEGALVIAVVDEVGMVREAYREPDGRILLVGRGAPVRVPAEAVVGRILRSLTVRSHAE